MAASDLKKAVAGLLKELEALPTDSQKRIAKYVRTIRKEMGINQFEKAFGAGGRRGHAQSFLPIW
jgi:hypothetical protein